MPARPGLGSQRGTGAEFKAGETFPILFLPRDGGDSAVEVPREVCRGLG